MKFETVKNVAFLLQFLLKWKKFFNSFIESLLNGLDSQKIMEVIGVLYTPSSFQTSFIVAVTQTKDVETMVNENWQTHLSVFISLHFGYLLAFSPWIKKNPLYIIISQLSLCFVSVSCVLTPLCINVLPILNYLQGFLLGLLLQQSEFQPFSSHRIFSRIVMVFLLSTIIKSILNWKYIFYINGIVGFILHMLLKKQKSYHERFYNDDSNTPRHTRIEWEVFTVNTQIYQLISQYPRKFCSPVALARNISVTGSENNSVEKFKYNFGTSVNNKNLDFLEYILEYINRLFYLVLKLEYKNFTILKNQVPYKSNNKHFKLQQIYNHFILNISTDPQNILLVHTNDEINMTDNHYQYYFSENEYWTIYDVEFWNVYKQKVQSQIILMYMLNGAFEYSI